MNTSYILMIITILSKVFGLLREQALAYFFGTGLVADVFLVAFQVPMIFTNVISGAVANGYIPMYDAVREREGKDASNKFTANLSNIIAIITIIISIFVIIFAPFLVKLMAEGFTGEKLGLAIFLSRAACTSIFVTSVASIFKAYLQIQGKFIISVLHGIIMNLIIISFMFLGYKFGINYLAIGFVLAFTLQYVILIAPVRKSGYKHKFTLNFKDRNIMKLFQMILPILISTSAIEINFMVSRSLASGLFEGAISTLNYAYKLQAFVTGIVVTSIITATYPKMAKMGAEKDFIELKNSCKEAISTMSLLVIPAAFGLFIFSFEIVNLLFVRGEFSVADGKITAVILTFYAFGVIAIGIREIISRVFYSLDDTKTPVFNSLIIVGVNIILSFVLSKIIGIRGLALATTISFIVGAISLLIKTRKYIGNVLERDIFINLLKITIASIVMAILSRLFFVFINVKLGINLSLMLSIMVAGIVYLFSLFILRVEELKNLIRLIKKY